MEKLYRVQMNKNGMPDFSTAEEVESKQGEWIEFGTISHNYECSVCGRKIFHTTVGKNHVSKYYPYCHCGAMMKGADNEMLRQL